MQVQVAYQTDPGQVRALNEDYILANETLGLFIVADGLGGQEAGEVASQLAATTIEQYLHATLTAIEANSAAVDQRETLKQALEEANAVVFSAARAAQHQFGMATTIVVALVQMPHVYLGHAGDARAYHFHQGNLHLLTEDHSLISQLRAAGVIAADAEPPHIQNVVTQAIGSDAELEPGLSRITIQEDDWLVLCSDGFWNMVEEHKLQQALEESSADLSATVGDLVAQANAAGGHDNISLLLMHVTA